MPQLILNSSKHEIELMIEGELRQPLEASFGEKECALGRINVLIIEVEIKKNAQYVLVKPEVVRQKSNI